MTVEKLFKKNLKQTIKAGNDHTRIDQLGGCIRKIVLTQAEAEAGKLTWQTMMQDKLWNDPEFEGRGWMFGSPETNLNIGLVPSKLADQRRGLNNQNWHLYKQVI